MAYELSVLNSGPRPATITKVETLADGPAGATVATVGQQETVERTIDLPGVATLTVGLAALVLALIEGNSWHWGSLREIALYATALIGLGGFAVVETRRRLPMVDFSFFRSRTFLGANVVAFIVSFAMLAMFFFLALYMQNIRGYSPLQAGVRFLPSTLMIVLLAPVAGRLSDRVGPRPLITAGLLCVSVSLFKNEVSLPLVTEPPPVTLQPAGADSNPPPGIRK